MQMNRYARILLRADSWPHLTRTFSSIMCDANSKAENVLPGVSRSSDTRSRSHHRDTCSKSVNPRKRRHHFEKNSSADETLSPLKCSLAEGKEHSAPMAETSGEPNNAPCVVRTSISVAQLFSSVARHPSYCPSANTRSQSGSPVRTADLPPIPCAPTCESVQAVDKCVSVVDGHLGVGAASNRLGQCREWEVTERGRAHAARPVPGMEVTVMSYNVLAQRLLEDHAYLYSTTQSEALGWEHRWKLLQEEMTFHAADVMCLQEVQEDHFLGFFQPFLETLGYKGVYQKRTGDKCDGCATFYKQAKFSLGRAVPVEFCRGGLLDRDNIALVLELRPRPEYYTGGVGKLCIANTHLLFNPRRGDVKLGQLVVLMAELDRIAKLAAPLDRTAASNSVPFRIEYSPVIMCGDFNSEPSSDLYKFVVRGYIKYVGLLSRLLSGQKEGTYGRDIFLKDDFFSKGFGITDQCQYIPLNHSTSGNVHDGRGSTPRTQTREAVGKETSADPEVSRHGDARVGGDPNHGGGPRAPIPRQTHYYSMGSGQLWHKLNFVSSYTHTISRLHHQWKEVTTQHDRGACNVDFIFYSVRHKEVHTKRNKIYTRNIQEDKLQLLRRYGLMSEREVSSLGGLPNPLCPSDHMPLISAFFLQQ